MSENNSRFPGGTGFSATDVLLQILHLLEQRPDLVEKVGAELARRQSAQSARISAHQQTQLAKAAAVIATAVAPLIERLEEAVQALAESEANRMAQIAYLAAHNRANFSNGTLHHG